MEQIKSIYLQPGKYTRLATRAVAAILPVYLLGGCMVGPDYVRPSAPSAQQYHSADALAAVARPDAPALKQWWAGFDDPILSRIVDRALAQNLDLSAAQARVEQARAAAGQAETAWLPQGSLSGSVARQRQSEFSPLGTIASQFPGYSRNQTLQQLGAGTSWELDLAGGRHRQAEAANAQVRAAEAAHAGTRISIVAEAADAYFQVRSAQAAMRLLDMQVDTDRQYLRVIENRIDQGVALDRDRHDVQAQLAEDETLLPAIRVRLEQQSNRLDVLMGDVPGTDAAGIRQAAKTDYAWVLPGIPRDVRPAQLLRRRPDVIAAEWQFASATANIGVALSEYYPDISLAGILGFERLGSGNLFSSRAFQPAALAGIRWRLFDFGRVDAQVRQAKGAQAEALAQYRQAALRAADDTEGALTALAQSHVRTQQWQAVVDADERARQSTQRSFEQGAASMAELLLRQRVLLQARRAWVLASGDQARSVVGAYRALGGGWEPDEPNAMNANRNGKSEPYAANSGDN